MVTKERIIIWLKNLKPFFVARMVLLFIFILAILLIKNQISDFSNKTVLTLADINTQNQLIGQAAELRQQYNEYYTLLPAIHALLPNQDNLPSFVADVEAAGRKSGLDSTAIKFVGEPISSPLVPNVKEISIILSAGGTGATFANLFEELAAMPYFIRFNRIDVDAQGGIEGTALLRANGTLFLK